MTTEEKQPVGPNDSPNVTLTIRLIMQGKVSTILFLVYLIFEYFLTYIFVLRGNGRKGSFKANKVWIWLMGSHRPRSHDIHLSHDQGE